MTRSSSLLTNVLVNFGSIFRFETIGTSPNVTTALLLRSSTVTPGNQNVKTTRDSTARALEFSLTSGIKLTIIVE